MKTITHEAGAEQDETVSAFLMMVLEYGSEIGLFTLLERLVKVKLKEVVYSRSSADTALSRPVANQPLLDAL